MFFFLQEQADGGSAPPQEPGSIEATGDLASDASNLISQAKDDPIAAINALKIWGIEHLPAAIGAILTLVLGLWLAKLISKAVHKGLLRGNADEMLANFLGKVVKMVLIAVVLISVVGQLGVETTSFAAILAAAGFAIGMALSGTLGNFASGVMILLFRPFKIGHYVEVAGHGGVIEEINVFMTQLRTGDNKQILIPNGEITSGSITNYSAKSTRRVELVIGISYDDDIKKAHEVLNRILEENKLVLKDPAPLVAVKELGADSVNFVVRPWVKSGDYWTVHYGLTETIKLTFDKEGLNFPYPQRDVHIYKQEA